ncbi:hypothetical protein FCU45_05250 [Sulfurimonas crateris]|uniref:DUF2846 domain-containing protein n=1 Tax=Sulfurimonas crateris TaxID=2574727 RepID=A0A4U2Z7Z2_9BACT|nr:hypothetical protein [Sulfurimonas crateris]TKI70015.1 hypothetical protein FCU45_05250 [Sulfurimonas crateris]
MRSLFLSILVMILFNGYSKNQVSASKEISLPHYNPSKANLYFVNTDTDSLGEYKVTYLCDSETISIVVLSRQYSYNEVAAGKCSISVMPYSTHPFLEARKDHIPLEINVKPGESYIFKMDKNIDTKTAFKAMFALFPVQTVLDHHLTVILEDKSIGAKNIQEVIDWKPFLVDRLYPPRANGKTIRDYL